MKKYRGQFIDGLVFKSEAEIDRFILDRSVREYRSACRMFNNHPDMEHSVYMDEIGDLLHNLGMSWDEIEQIELDELEAA